MGTVSDTSLAFLPVRDDPSCAPPPVIHPRPHNVARFVGQATISHLLKVLREAGLIAVDRRGIWAHYTIAPSVRGWLDAVFS